MAESNGCLMSSGAAAAYHNGERPFSKWNKTDILVKIENENINLACDMELLKKVPVAELKNLSLRKTASHHTSIYYNRTDFFP